MGGRHDGGHDGFWLALYRVGPAPLVLRQAPVDGFLAYHHAMADELAAQCCAVPMMLLNPGVDPGFGIAPALLELARQPFEDDEALSAAGRDRADLAVGI